VLGQCPSSSERIGRAPEAHQVVVYRKDGRVLDFVPVTKPVPVAKRNRDRFLGFWFEPTPTFYFTAETDIEN
jgi:hypothetical protein